MNWFIRERRISFCTRLRDAPTLIWTPSFPDNPYLPSPQAGTETNCNWGSTGDVAGWQISTYAVIIKLTRYTVGLQHHLSMMASPFTSHIIIINIHQQWRIDTKSDTTPAITKQHRSYLQSTHCVSLHANITHDKSGQWSEASSHTHGCPVNGKDAYQTKVHYLHKLCTPHRIRRSLTKSNKHTCVHLHQPSQTRSASEESPINMATKGAPLS